MHAGLVSVDEYLHTVYEPDCDYVHGVLVDRNAGEKAHSIVLSETIFALAERRRGKDLSVFPITRMRVSPTCYRVPDISVFLGRKPDEEIFTTPPFLFIEVLSPEDRAGTMLAKICDYLAFGVSYVWLIDPETREAWIYTRQSVSEVRDGVLRTREPEIAIPLQELFTN